MFWGIDFGTTNSFIAEWEDNNRPPVSALGGRTGIPSIAVPRNDNMVFGENAVGFPERLVIRSFKRTLLSGSDTVDRHPDCSAREVAKGFLKFLYDEACNQSFTTPDGVAIGVPVKANEYYRNTLREIAIEAGIPFVALIEEPIAAGVCLLNLNNNSECQNIVIYDFGGGTFDATLLQKNPNNIREPLKVIDHNGDDRLGGNDCDEKLLELVLQKINKMGHTASDSESDLAELRNSITRAKERLSIDDETPIDVITTDRLRETVTVTVDEFNDAIRGLVQRTVDITKDIIIKANGKGIKVNEVMLVGGSSQIPLVRNVMAEMLYENGDIPLRMYSQGLTIAAGASAYAESIHSNTNRIGTISSFTYGIKVLNKNHPELNDSHYVCNMLVKNCRIPGSEEQFFNTADSTSQVRLSVYESSDETSISRIQDSREACSCILNFGEIVEKDTLFTIRMSIDESGILHMKAFYEKTGKTAECSVSVLRKGVNGIVF